MESKKALSPVITTVLLVLIAIILAVIIFMWAVAFRGEQITKFISGEKKDISISCDSVVFSAELAGNQISIVNTGDIPIYRFDIRIEGNVNSKIASINSETSRVNPGAAKSIDIAFLGTLPPGTEIKIIPILLGTDKDGAEKEASCINSGKWEILKVE